MKTSTKRRVPRMLAWADCPVSTGLLAEGGRGARQAIRQEIRRALEGAARESGVQVPFYRRLRYLIDPVERYGFEPWEAQARGDGYHVVRGYVTR